MLVVCLCLGWGCGPPGDLLESVWIPDLSLTLAGLLWTLVLLLLLGTAAEGVLEPALALHTVPHSVAKVDEETHSHPYGEAYPGVSTQLDHEVNIDKYTQDGKKWDEWNHEGDLPAGLRLLTDENHTANEDHQGQGQTTQDPGLHENDGISMVGGQSTDHTHH